MTRRDIGEIGNYYGGLSIRRESDKCFWAIEDYDGFNEQEIPKYLFDALTKYQDELDNQSLKESKKCKSVA